MQRKAHRKQSFGTKRNGLEIKQEKLRNAGREYVSSSKLRKVISMKDVKEAFSEKCTYKCSTKVSQGERLIIFNEYYSLCDISRECEFINRHAELIQPTIERKL